MYVSEGEHAPVPGSSRYSKVANEEHVQSLDLSWTYVGNAQFYQQMLTSISLLAYSALDSLWRISVQV